jgi:hypothetical protein
MIQTNLSLPDDLAAELRRRAPRPVDQAECVAAALRAWFESHPDGSSDRELIDAHADELNREAADVLEYQAWP